MCVIKFFLEGFCVRLSDADVMVWFSLLSRPRTVCLWREIPVPCIPVTEVTGMRLGSQWDATRKSMGCVPFASRAWVSRLHPAFGAPCQRTLAARGVAGCWRNGAGGLE